MMFDYNCAISSQIGSVYESLHRFIDIVYKLEKDAFFMRGADKTYSYGT